MIFIFLEYLNVLLSSLAAGHWARKAGCYSPVADVMVFIVSPLLAMQMFAGIAVMALGMHIDFQAKAFVYYASVPYWAIQFLVLGALMWAFRTRPLWIDAPVGEVKLQMNPTEESLAYYSAQPYAPHQLYPRSRQPQISAPRPQRHSLTPSAPPAYVSQPCSPPRSPRPHPLRSQEPPSPRSDSPEPVPLRPYSAQPSTPLLFMPVLPVPEPSVAPWHPQLGVAPPQSEWSISV
ncbi:hypothetical protein AURDEDRAFT_110205 [Auricularia subglabra TFB-10046 SS5]|nr:hypothetical protein AURDEDRAFT_110205 [Auricularia subglabra TFB-10046 SS5]